MNKTFTINLNGRVYNINDDAYIVLNQYLESLKTLFSSEEGVNEIMEDIEARVGELFSERMRYGMQVISAADVQDMIKIMGNPAEIENDEASEINTGDINGLIDENSQNEQTQPNEPEDKTTDKGKEKKIKRLFRNPDNKVIAGVCSGISAYLNIDPIIVRILFILFLLFSYGIAIIAYAILWVIIPEAKNIAQKLQMMGEDPNVENIRQAVNDGELNQPDKQPSNLNVVLGFIVKLIAIIAIAFLIITIAPMLFILIPLLLFFTGAGSFFPEIMHGGMSPMTNGIMEFSMKSLIFTKVLVGIGAFLLLAIPVGSLIHYILVKYNRAKPMSSGLKLGLIISWIVIMITMTVTGVISYLSPM